MEKIKPINFRIDDLKLNKVIITDVYYWKDVEELIKSKEKELFDELNKMIDENSYCLVCGNGLINVNCIGHPESIIVINRKQLKESLSMRSKLVNTKEMK